MTPTAGETGRPLEEVVGTNSLSHQHFSEVVSRVDGHVTPATVLLLNLGTDVRRVATAPLAGVFFQGQSRELTLLEGRPVRTLIHPIFQVEKGPLAQERLEFVALAGHTEDRQTARVGAYPVILDKDIGITLRFDPRKPVCCPMGIRQQEGGLRIESADNGLWLVVAGNERTTTAVLWLDGPGDTSLATLSRTVRELTAPEERGPVIETLARGLELGLGLNLQSSIRQDRPEDRVPERV